MKDLDLNLRGIIVLIYIELIWNSDEEINFEGRV